jgi:hypothetical protein
MSSDYGQTYESAGLHIGQEFGASERQYNPIYSLQSVKNLPYGRGSESHVPTNVLMNVL